MAPCALSLVQSRDELVHTDTPWQLTRLCLQQYCRAQQQLVFNYAKFAGDFRPLIECVGVVFVDVILTVFQAQCRPTAGNTIRDRRRRR